jgi:spore maturation protein CgeB
MKILYASLLSPNDTSLYRIWALERLGHTVIPFNAKDYIPTGRVLRALSFRLVAGPGIDRLNRDLLRLVEAEKPDVLWADKLLWVRPRTLDRIRTLGVVLVSYMIDNAFGPRRDPGWRLYMKDIPHYDLHVIQRDSNFADYRSRGARDVIKIQTAYEPTLQFPPPSTIPDSQRDRGVSFIGTPYDDRATTLTKLAALDEFTVVLSGNTRNWKNALDPATFAKIFRHGELFLQQYREGIWHSRINLSFLTHSNQDEFVHKSFEIAGCEGFLLAERSQGHLDRFKEDEEAVFFTGYDELLAKIRLYYNDEAARNRIAAAGRARAERDGYHNDRQVSIILERVEQIIAKTSR